jgi:hypothetical protein
MLVSCDMRYSQIIGLYTKCPPPRRFITVFTRAQDTSVKAGGKQKSSKVIWLSEISRKGRSLLVAQVNTNLHEINNIYIRK